MAFLYDFHLWLFPFSCNSMPWSGCLHLLEKDLRRMGEVQQNYHTKKMLPVTMRVSTGSGVKEIRELEVFTCYFSTVLWLCTCWYCLAGITSPSTFLRFLALTHNRGKPTIPTNFWILPCSGITQQHQSTTNTKFWTKLF